MTINEIELCKGRIEKMERQMSKTTDEYRIYRLMEQIRDYERLLSYLLRCAAERENQLPDNG